MKRRDDITDHHDGHGLLETMEIKRLDDKGPGGAHHRYEVRIPNREGYEVSTRIQFQRGPREEPDSIPGILEPVLLAIVMDRLKAFQAGEYACRENAIALTKIEEALLWMKRRADNRAKRGVLGTTEK